MRDANVVCHQLGYPWSYSTTPQAQPDVSLGDRGFSQFLCIGNEFSTGECQFTTGGQCTTSPAGVQCGVGKFYSLLYQSPRPYNISHMLLVINVESDTALPRQKAHTVFSGAMSVGSFLSC